MMVKEHPTGLGMQLRLVAGPLNDRCSRREDLRRADREQPALRDVDLRWSAPCYEGRDGAPRKLRPHQLRPAPRRRAAPKPQERAEQAPPPKPVEEVAPPKPQSSLTSFLGLR